MRQLALIFMLILSVGVFLFAFIDNKEETNIDIIELNVIVKKIEENWQGALNGQLPVSDKLDYILVPDGLPINSYIANGDTLVDIIADGRLIGKVVIFNDSLQRIQAVKTRTAVIFYTMSGLVALTCVLFALHLHITILRPFKKLEVFASRVAQGNLEIPLDMDKRNRFGAFTESFDIMREQLAYARENERQANKSKTELVASLSHDIKTPVASIKALAELYQAKKGSAAEIDSIVIKADQIDRLISNMFSATLDELKQLLVSPEDIPISELAEIIRSSDYESKIKPFIFPECIVTVDKLKFRQVVDNIISNSYKYAGTDIEVSADFDGDYIVFILRDFGSGVLSEELPLLCEKFYRAKNAKGKNGSGLGLYLSKYFITEMGGTLNLENNNGLCVKIHLKI